MRFRHRIYGVIALLAWAAPRGALAAEQCGHDCPAAQGGETLVSVAQLEETLRNAQGKPDDRIAEQLARVRLTERLSAAELAHLEDSLQGPQSRRALTVLADMSAFLLPPANQLPADPVPPVEAQARWLTRAVAYAAGVLSRLPNFYASRNVTYFADTPATETGSLFQPYQTLHLVGDSTATVLYRDGKEVVDGTAPSKPAPSPPKGLITSGEFGSLLGLVLSDAAHSSIRWNHWEQGISAPAAVYRYAVGPGKSHYQVTFCCIPEGAAMRLYRQVTAYHGEIAVDPDTGAILRLTLQADLRPKRPMARAEILVEYGNVEIGGRSYVCPQRSVAVASAAVRPDGDASESLHFRGMLSEETKDYDLPVQTLVNETSFNRYHLFRSDARILPAVAPN